MKESSKKLKSLIPIEKLEQTAQQQIYKNLELDFLIKLAIMPDCHAGYTLPIGGVALLDCVISPEYVGYDIGCGMCYVDTGFPANEFFRTPGSKTLFFNEIYERIPVGFNSRKSALEYKDFKNASKNLELYNKVFNRLYIQLGTLGGGNHFIELGENKAGNLTITIHSGSRNVGHSIASYYMKMSKTDDLHLPKGFLDFNSELGKQYFEDMNFALDYALENRKTMMKEILYMLGYNNNEAKKLMDIKMINENHNHASIHKDDLILHRKGATQSEKGQMGIIPGNMRDGVYVTEGLGNEEYLCSSSHGAGRKYSRKKAKEEISLDSFETSMVGIVAKIDMRTIDESPDAYKDFHEIISMQEDIVIKTVDLAKPLINVKG